MKSGNGDYNNAKEELYNALINEIEKNRLLEIITVGTLQKNDVILIKAAQLLNVELYPQQENQQLKNQQLKNILNTNTVQQNFKGVLESLDFISLLQGDYPNLSEDVKTKFGYFDPSTKSLALDFQRLKSEMEEADKERQQEGQQEGQRSYDSDDDGLGDDEIRAKMPVINENRFPIVNIQEAHKNDINKPSGDDFTKRVYTHEEKLRARKKIGRFIQNSLNNRHAKDSLCKSVEEAKEVNAFWYEKLKELEGDIENAKNKGDEKLLQALEDKKYEFLEAALNSKHQVDNMKNLPKEIKEKYEKVIDDINVMNIQQYPIKKHSIYIPQINQEAIKNEDTKNTKNRKPITIKTRNPFKRLLKTETQNPNQGGGMSM